MLSGLAVLGFLSLASAAPIDDLVPRSVATVSSSELASFAPFTQFARAAYCSTAALKTWTCGEACAAVPDFKPSLVGGNGGSVQQFFVGYWPSRASVVVGHQGTDPLKIQSVLTDLDLVQKSLDTSLFPGVSSSVKVHHGFRDEHAGTAPQILAEVKKLLTANGSKAVIVVGHSLGGALAELSALFFTLQLPAGTSISAITYGTPRAGNAEWAELIDAKIPGFKRINNKKDLIPILPGRFLGYSHPEGEIHILGKGSAVKCSGNDNNVDSQCQIETVPTVLNGNILDHLGPYEGIGIGSIFCY